MHGDMKLLLRAFLAGLTICLIILGLFFLASVITSLLGLPAKLNLPEFVKLIGAAIFIGGLGLALWLFRYRSPVTMIVSTYYTFGKMFTGSPVSKSGGRKEAPVVKGPQKFVRHPLYLGAATMFLGWALFTDSTSSLLAVLFVLIWFISVQIPFEERELHALFGDQYARYSEEVPMLIPFSKSKRKSHSSHPKTN
jgi:protein-S-isoprenylcysteine O-methyltransferase Ste14